MNSNNQNFKWFAESGQQLLARLDSRPTLEGLEQKLFGSGPSPHDIIEISGGGSSGKTILVIQLIAKCLLPKSWNDICIGGLGTRAILIDTDHHFQIFKLISIMEDIITSSASLGSSSQEVDNIVLNIVEKALSNLIILSCFDSSEFFVTFHSLERILSNNKDISLLVIDSLTAYYWPNTLEPNGIRKKQLYLEKCLSLLHRNIKYYKISVIYTLTSDFQWKSSEFHDKSKRVVAGAANTGAIVSRRIHLQRLPSKDTFRALISSSAECDMHFYKIDRFSLKWL